MSEAPRVWLDHLVVGIDDLERGIASFQSLTGVRPEFGGAHPALGTHNALVSLGGDQYLEILAPRPGAEVHPLFAAASRHRQLTPYLWALATDDIAWVHQTTSDAGFPVGDISSGSRVTADSQTLRWSMFSMRPGSPDGAPFFIEWDPDTQHPSRTTPSGCVLDGFAVASEDATALRGMLSLIGMEALVVARPEPSRIVLNTPHGAVALEG